MPPACHACGATLAIDPPVPRDLECGSCGRDVRCCANCRHYDPAYHNACRETEAEPVEEKERRNFCEYFVLAEARRAAGPSRAAEARSRLDALFGGGGAPAPPPAAGADRRAEAKRRLDALFGKPPPEAAGDPEP